MTQSKLYVDLNMLHIIPSAAAAAAASRIWPSDLYAFKGKKLSEFRTAYISLAYRYIFYKYTEWFR